jgi:peptidoglycan hydrolase-like protein with peptidoglycan-binding domain
MSAGGSSRTGIWIAVAIVVAAVVIGGVLLLTRGGDDGSPSSATPTASASPSPSASYYSGMSTEQTMQLQKGLAAYGFYTGPIDGVYGQETMDAVKRAQTKLGVPADGIWGPETSQAYQAYVKAQSGKNKPDAFVMQMQADLTTLGYYTGKVDGFYGPDTEAAVKAFQKDNGLPVTGKFDEATVNAIDAALKHPTATPTPTKTPTPTPTLTPTPTPS